MAENIDEQLSSLVDGECSAAEAVLAVRRLCKQPQLAARWRRYHLISDAINGQLPAALPADFADRVSRTIAAEAPIAVATPRRGGAPRRNWIPASVAASLALAFGVYTQSVSPPSGPPVADTASPPAVAVAAGSPPVPAADSADPDAVNAARRAALESRLSRYLSSHSEYASVNGVYGILPYVHQTAARERR